MLGSAEMKLTCGGNASMRSLNDGYRERERKEEEKGAEVEKEQKEDLAALKIGMKSIYRVYQHTLHWACSWREGW